jgi:signal transduction histidine kinase
MRAARRGSATRNFKCGYVHMDGHTVPLMWTAVWSEPDRRHYFIGRDMTEYNKTEDQLRQALKMEAVGQLTGGVAHDFNNILMVIMGNVEALEEGDPDPRLLDPIQRIARATERAAELVRQLLAFSRKQALRPQRTNINSLVAATATLACGRWASRSKSVPSSPRICGAWKSTAQLDRPGHLAINARDAMPRAAASASRPATSASTRTTSP